MTDSLRECLVERFMTPAPVCLDAGCTVGAALAFLARGSAAPVVGSGQEVQGVVTRASLLAWILTLRERLGPSATVKQLLDAPMGLAVQPVRLRAAAGMTLRDASSMLASDHAAALLIEAGGHLVGILTLRDIARAVAFSDQPDRLDWRAGQGRGYDAMPESFFPADHELLRLLAPKPPATP